MIKRLFSVALLILIIMLYTNCTVSKRLTLIQKAPTDSTLISSIDLSALQEKYNKYDGVYLDVKDIFEHSATKGTPLLSRSGEWSYHRISSVKYLINNPDKERLGTFSTTLSPRANINSFYLVTLSPDHKIQRYDHKNLIIEKDYRGNLIHKFAIPDIKKGTIVEYGLDISYRGGPLDYEIELQYDLPCEKLFVEFAYPDWWKIRTKKISAGVDIDYKVTRNVEENKQILTYKAENIQAITPEPFTPFFNEVAKYLRINFTLIDLLYPQEFYKDWNEVADDYKDYAMNKESLFSNKAGSKSEDLIEGINDPLVKLDTIINFIQQNIKIADDQKDRKFGTVLKEGMGSIYEICGLAEAMLREAELETDYLLVHSAKSGYLDKDFISYDQFQVPAVRVKIDSIYYVVIPYYKYLPIDFLPEHLQEQPALIVSNNDLVQGKFWNIPIGKLGNNNLEENYEITITDDGILNVKETKIAYGSFGYELREYFDERTEKEIEKDMREILTYTEGNIDIKKYEIVNQEDYKKPLKINIEYSINNLVTITPDEILFHTGGLLSPSSKYKKRLDPRDRVNPIVIYNDQLFTKNIKINYPKSWIPIKKIENISFKNDFGENKAVYSYNDGEINIHQATSIFKNKQPKEKVEELLKVTGSISELQVPVIIFNVSN